MEADVEDAGGAGALVVGDEVAAVHGLERQARQVDGEAGGRLGERDGAVVDVEPARGGGLGPGGADQEERPTHGDLAFDQGAGDHRARALDREDAVDAEPGARAGAGRGQGQERAADGVADGVDAFAGAGRAAHHLGLPAIAQQLPGLVAGELGHVGADAIELGHRDHGAAEAEQLAGGDVLAGLRHHALVGGHDQEDQLHADGTRDHGVDELAVAGHVDDAHLHALAQVPRGEAELDGDAPALFLGQAVGVDPRQGAHQGGLAMVDVAGRAQDEAPHGAHTTPSTRVRATTTDGATGRQVVIEGRRERVVGWCHPRSSKSVRGSSAVLGRFDSCALPPLARSASPAAPPRHPQKVAVAAMPPAVGVIDHRTTAGGGPSAAPAPARS